jgi:hypothetical protein
MANQYTGEAYMGVKPVEADFGQVGMNALNIDMALRAFGLEQEKMYAKQAREAQQKLEANLKDFDKLATGALNLQPQAFDQQGVAILMEHTQQEIADMRRELANPLITPTRKSEIMVKIGDMKNKAASYTNQMKSFQTFLEGLSKTGKGGIDDVMNVGLIGALNEAILLAGKEGVKSKGNGIYSLGGMIDMYYANGMLNFTMYDKNGEALATGSPAELQAKLSGRLKPFVDLDGLMDNSIKQIGDSVVRSFQRTPDGNILNIESTNLNNIKQRAGDYWEATFRNNYETNPYMQKGATIGLWDTPEQAKAYFVDRVAMAADQNVKQSLQKDPSYQGYGGGSRDNRFIEPVMDAIPNAFNGHKEAIQMFVGNKSSAYIDDNGVNRKAQLNDITAKGDITTFHFLGEGKKKQGRPVNFDQPFTINFDANDPSSVKRAYDILANYYNSGAQTKEKILDIDLRDWYNYNVSPRVEPVAGRDENKNPVYNRMRPVVSKLQDLASTTLSSPESYKPEDFVKNVEDIIAGAKSSGVISIESRRSNGGLWSGYMGNYLVIKDPATGNEIAKINLSTAKSAAEQLNSALNQLTGIYTRGSYGMETNPNFYRYRNNTSTMITPNAPGVKRDVNDFVNGLK